jgi:BolA family transcriptional regulator, general stress-responsive regulator
MSAEGVARIRARLEQALSPHNLEIKDDSAAHAGHPGASRGGHYRVFIVAPAFDGRTARERHRAVYEALGELMTTDVHALSISALAPGEAAAGKDLR